MVEQDHLKWMRERGGKASWCLSADSEPSKRSVARIGIFDESKRSRRLGLPKSVASARASVFQPRVGNKSSDGALGIVEACLKQGNVLDQAFDGIDLPGNSVLKPSAISAACRVSVVDTMNKGSPVIEYTLSMNCV